MTATDKLRNLLDKRGVEWKEKGQNKTKWSHDGIEYVAYNAWPRNGGATRLILCANLIPEQAIEATLGSGECEIETTENWLPAERYHRCKHCGAFFAVMNASGDIQPCVCPNCGRKVKR